jgi:hypothetical protein
MSHAAASDGLQQAQARYAAIIPKNYVQSGVTQLQENAHSALSMGISPDDARTGLIQGRRWLMTASNGRSASTSMAAPVFEEYW